MQPARMRPFPHRLGRTAQARIAGALVIAAVVLFFALRVGLPGERANAPHPAPPAPGSASQDALPGQEPSPSADAPNLRAALPEVGANSTPNSARPRGVVLDAGTREPLPAYLMEFFAAGDGSRKKLLAISDEAGRFELDTEFPFGKLRIQLIDDPGLGWRNNEYVTREFGPGVNGSPQPIELSAVSGPTCFFELEFPAGTTLADFDVSLRGGRPFQVLFHPPDPVHAKLRAPHAATLHPRLPWVRFGEKANSLGVGFVELRSNDGRWRGGNWIQSVEGINAEPVKIEFTSAISLIANVSIPVGSTSETADFRLIERVPKNSKRRPRKHAASCGAEGKLRFEFLEPGDYRLFTHDANWFPFEREVTIARGENDIGTITLLPRPVVGAIRGTIESKSGKYEGACHISLSNTPFEHDALFDHSLDFEDDGSGKLVARFELENVTAGEWFLYVHCHDGFSHTTSLRTLTAPADDVRIVLDDLVASVEIDLVDASSGELLSEESAVTWQVGEAFDRADGPRIRLEGLPDAPERLTLLAEAPGYQPLRKTAADFERIPSSENSPATLRATFKLQRGFGGILRVRDRSSGSPIEGAEITIDGAVAGTSDADGEFWIELKARPSRIGIRKPGWLWVPTPDVDSQTGRLGDGPEFDAAMESIE